MEQDRMPPNKLMFLVNSLQQKLQEYTIDDGQGGLACYSLWGCKESDRLSD